nr:recombination protein O N-terminal domain-containing protein [Candidatus Microthrix sp.]
MVLRTHKLGEADRIIVLMTEGRGKVRAVAKGATHRIEVRQPPRAGRSRSGSAA